MFIFSTEGADAAFHQVCLTTWTQKSHQFFFNRVHPVVFNNLQGKEIARNFDSRYQGLFSFPVYIVITDGDCGCSLVSRGSWRLTGHQLHSPLDHVHAFLHVCLVFVQYWEQRVFILTGVCFL